MSLLAVARNSSLGNSLNKLNSIWTVLLLPLCNQARPRFRFSTRTSSVVGLALCLVAFTRATLISSSLLVARTVQPLFVLSFDLDIKTRVADRSSCFPAGYILNVTKYGV